MKQDAKPETGDGMTTEDRPADTGAVLVIDLDSTLSRTDTLHEALLSIVFSAPLRLFDLLRWLGLGRAGFKAKVADLKTMGADELPLNDDVVALAKEARAEGRRVVLVSAAEERQVARIAEETGLFDEAHGSGAGVNLKAGRKRAFLDETYGPRGYDYVGDSTADLEVWRGARQAYGVEVPARLRAQMRAALTDPRFLGSRAGVATLVRAMRPYQWSKNLLVFLPMLAAHRVDVLPQVIFAALAFSCMASSAYLINDLGDLAADRAHPRKCRRPFAAGRMSLAGGAGAAGALALAGSLLGAATGQPLFLATLFLYLAATLAYSFWLKRRAVIDVLTLSGLYTLRIIGGGTAAAVMLSPWLLGFSMFLFLALAAVKRQTELAEVLGDEGTIAGRGYSSDDLPVMRGIALSAANATVMVFALYLSSPNVTELYSQPEFLWGVCPLLLYWLYRMVFKAHRGLMTDDPIVFAAMDKVSLATIAGCALLTAIAV